MQHISFPQILDYFMTRIIQFDNFTVNLLYKQKEILMDPSNDQSQAMPADNGAMPVEPVAPQMPAPQEPAPVMPPTEPPVQNEQPVPSTDMPDPLAMPAAEPAVPTTDPVADPNAAPAPDEQPAEPEAPQQFGSF